MVDSRRVGDGHRRREVVRHVRSDKVQPAAEECIMKQPMDGESPIRVDAKHRQWSRETRDSRVCEVNQACAISYKVDDRTGEGMQLQDKTGTFTLRTSVKHSVFFCGRQHRSR